MITQQRYLFPIHRAATLDSRTLLLQQAGALADDESLSALREAIYAARKRPEVASAQDS